MNVEGSSTSFSNRIRALAKLFWGKNLDKMKLREIESVEDAGLLSIKTVHINSLVGKYELHPQGYASKSHPRIY